MKSGTTSLLKFKMLKSRLCIPLYQTTGLLSQLWEFTDINAPAGDIGRFSDGEIACGVEWEKDPEEMIDALVKTRWLDPSKQHRLIVHDWSQHCEYRVHRKLAIAARLFADGSIPSLGQGIGAKQRIEILHRYHEMGAIESSELRSRLTKLDKSKRVTDHPEPLPLPLPLPLPRTNDVGASDQQGSLFPDSETILQFETKNGKWRLTKSVFDQWCDRYGYDVTPILKNLQQWCIDNSAKRKESRNMTRFLGGCLARAAKPGPNGANSEMQRLCRSIKSEITPAPQFGAFALRYFEEAWRGDGRSWKNNGNSIDKAAAIVAEMEDATEGLSIFRDNLKRLSGDVSFEEALRMVAEKR